MVVALCLERRCLGFESLVSHQNFKSVEHAYVAAKTLDFDLQQTIADIKTPVDVKKFGRKLMLRDDWEDVKFSIMNDLLIQKFAQEPFKSQLLNTGDAYLEETNHWGDVIWGVCNGVGQNNLGHMLIHIRDDIRSLEMWQSGRLHRVGNAKTSKEVREFESHHLFKCPSTQIGKADLLKPSCVPVRVWPRVPKQFNIGSGLVL